MVVQCPRGVLVIPRRGAGPSSVAYTGGVLLAEELALIAVDEDSGRHALGTRDQLNACLAGLLVAELVLDGAAAPGERKGTVVVTGEPARGPLLSAVADVIAEKGPKIKAVLSHMSRGSTNASGWARGTPSSTAWRLPVCSLRQRDCCDGIRWWTEPHATRSSSVSASPPRVISRSTRTLPYCCR